QKPRVQQRAHRIVGRNVQQRQHQNRGDAPRQRGERKRKDLAADALAGVDGGADGLAHRGLLVQQVVLRQKVPLQPNQQKAQQQNKQRNRKDQRHAADKGPAGKRAVEQPDRKEDAGGGKNQIEHRVQNRPHAGVDREPQRPKEHFAVGKKAEDGQDVVRNALRQRMVPGGDAQM